MEAVERAQVRLENIRSVQPILGALRTISLGSWQLSLRKKDNARRYGDHLLAMLPVLLPYLPLNRLADVEKPKNTGRVVALMIGSERGLCGRFNATVVEHFEQYMAEQNHAAEQIELAVLGSRAARLLQRQNHPVTWAGSLSATALPSAQLAFRLASGWLARYEAGELDAVDVIFNRYKNAGIYVPDIVRLIPPEIAPVETGDDIWPPPIVETNPLSLYEQVIGQLAALGLYNLLLESAAAEHSARFQLMESATQNIERLENDLTTTVQMAARQAITREMLDLAAGAGLVGS